MRVAIVTGAARGIGAATAANLGAKGWGVVLVDSCADDPALDYNMATREDLEVAASAANGVAVVGDVRSPADMERATDVAKREFGGVDAAVATAGVIAGGEPLWELSVERWRALVDINLGGTLNLARAVIPAMLERPSPRSGRFIGVSSGIALKASPKLAAYSASKAGIIGLVRGLAADLGDTGITANVVSPGTTDTAVLPPSAAVYWLNDGAEFAQHHIDHRLLAPRELAAAISWLVSPESSGITGAVIPVDAGMTAR